MFIVHAGAINSSSIRVPCAVAYAIANHRHPRPPRPLLLLLQHCLDGRIVEVKRAVPREEGREKVSSATRLDRRKIFVGGLAGTVTEEDFRAYFERYGAILDAVVMIDRDTNR